MMSAAMLDFFAKLFSADFMPHKMCYLGDAAVTWLNVISDCLIALSYYLIPVLLIGLVRKRKDVEFRWAFVAFAMFILACGTTHLLGAVTVWHPVYRLEGMSKAITAAASAATFVALIPFMPALVALPSPKQLALANQNLEEQVARRTASLEKALTDLRSEMKLRREAETQLIQAQKMEAVGRLAGGVAHDFNNLLTVILGYNDMLREQSKNDSLASEFVQEIRRAGERATSLTNRLLAFSRRQVAQPRVVDLNESVRGIEKMLGRIIGEDVQLRTSLAPDLLRVKVDPSHMDQVLMNLAVNSRDAMPGGGVLTIETSNVELGKEDAGGQLGVAPGAYVMLGVSDTGCGMDVETLARVFEPFFTTKEKGKGTGLGLSIVYGIVKQNGGDVLAYSEPGKGTAFKIYLPALTEAADVQLAEPAVSDAPAVETILLVEDEEQVRNLTRTMLQRMGYKVLEADGAAAAEEILRANREEVHLLLTDIVMPETRGTELADRVRTLRPAIRVLFMSGYTEGGVLQQGISIVSPYIQKPFTAATLRHKIREVLQG
jgi:signal transduction histidine kinase/CheY-like chemotaxis protein